MDGLTTDFNGLLMLSKMPVQYAPQQFTAPVKFSEPMSIKVELKQSESYFWKKTQLVRELDPHELNLEKAMTGLSKKSRLSKLMQVDQRF